MSPLFYKHRHLMTNRRWLTTASANACVCTGMRENGRREWRATSAFEFFRHLSSAELTADVPGRPVPGTLQATRWRFSRHHQMARWRWTGIFLRDWNAEQAIDVSTEASKEEDMRSHLLTVAASAVLAMIVLSASPANSITITTLAGVRHAADALRLAEAVHCRGYPHRHKDGRRWSRGCGVGAVTTGPRRPGVVVRDDARKVTSPRVPTQSLMGRSPGNFVNPSNPQDRSGSSNRQDMTQPRATNPQDMR